MGEFTFDSVGALNGSSSDGRLVSGSKESKTLLNVGCQLGRSWFLTVLSSKLGCPRQKDYGLRLSDTSSTSNGHVEIGVPSTTSSWASLFGSVHNSSIQYTSPTTVGSKVVVTPLEEVDAQGVKV
ncbi:uncharacterized protein E6C27_scaffold17G001080 [Cucumis melo var. makuwa]|uniref:Uncharacterized protein n=2 Tax=Cucumis melo TaxID=3656 RepID=A0A5A7VE13_CUCMM|nr:uncharacterized protein E6C27_scaffold17G001080 [Cucumis melo var. makuwa]